ncbi:hypothetical protein AGMMS49965_23950 [Bacteroidia bacterium]|nr:hypothetical protein AGMMS49965_23950 [Bacteroidia bacterium]
MKKKVFILVTVLLSGAMCLAQDSIPQKDTQLSDIIQEVARLTAEVDELGKNIWVSYILTIAVLVLLIALLIVLFKKQKKKVSDCEKQSDDLRTQDEITELKGEKGKLKKENRTLQTEISVLKKKIDELETANQAKINDPQENINELEKSTDSDSQDPSSPPPPPVSNLLYAKSINHGYFNAVFEHPNDDTIYKLEKSDELTANFTIYKEAYGTVLECPDLIEGCDKQNWRGKDQSLQIEEGTATLQDGKWKVTKKANVKFE